ncbi:unnamed protein product [Schistosoma curassoni]|uniref:tRNA-synt_1g domain-containing protein n=1 Tax=Schistosoma curassoni TaxID=6186 RepID=A0A183JHI0_9TREM|nr:unnamed protein product [Schistosoma curassoni]
MITSENFGPRCHIMYIPVSMHFGHILCSTEYVDIINKR